MSLVRGGWVLLTKTLQECIYLIRAMPFKNINEQSLIEILQ